VRCSPYFRASSIAEDFSSDGAALVLLSLICSNIRNCVRPASVIRALDILLALSRYLTDETKLDRLVPYLVAVLQDDMASVRSAALKTLTQTVRVTRLFLEFTLILAPSQLMLVSTITPSNAAVFPEYIFPNTRPFATDSEILPRATYAQCIAPLAQKAKRFLEMTEAMKTEGTFKLANVHEFAGSPYDVRRPSFSSPQRQTDRSSLCRKTLTPGYKSYKFKSRSTSTLSSPIPPASSNAPSSLMSGRSARSSARSEPTTPSSLTLSRTSTRAIGSFGQRGTRTLSTWRVA
jgi:hypothetical protein